MRLRSLRRLEEMEIGKERDGAGQGARGARQAGRKPGAAAHPAEEATWRRSRSKFGDERRTRIEEAARGARDRLVGDDREGADHRHPVAARLDPGDEGPSRARPGRRRSNGARATGRSSTSTPRPPTGWRCSPSNGRVYTLAGDKLPGARGFGEPVRLFIDLDAEVEIVQLLVVAAGDEAAGRLVATAAASSPAARRPSPRPARASSWSTSGPARRVAVVRPIAGERRRRRGDRREPQDAGLPAWPSCPSWRAGRA